MRRAVIWTLSLLLLAAPALAQPIVTSPNVTMQSAATATGNGTSINVGGYRMLTLQINAGAQDTYTLFFLGSVDATNYYPQTCYATGQTSGATSITTTASASGAVQDRAIYKCNVAGLKSFRVRINSITAKTGTGLSVIGLASTEPFSIGALTP